MLDELSFPETSKYAQSFVGVGNQLSSWIPGLSIKMKHLKALTSAFAVFPKFISADLEEKFNNLKKVLK